MSFKKLVEQLKNNEENKGYLLLIRCGVFFVGIGKDAVILSEELGISLKYNRSGYLDRYMLYSSPLRMVGSYKVPAPANHSDKPQQHRAGALLVRRFDHRSAMPPCPRARDRTHPAAA